MRTTSILALVALGFAACAGDEHGSLTLALGGYYGTDMATFTLQVFQGTPANDAAEPTLEYTCRTYQNDGFRVSGIEPATDYYVVFKGYRDADCTQLSYVGVRGNVRVEEDAATQGRYYLALLQVGGATLLADPGFSNLGQLNGAPCDLVDDKCGTYFSDLSAATCSGASGKCRMPCTTDADCTPLHPKAVCDDDGLERYCVFSDAFPLNNAEARGFALGAPLSNGGVGLVGGLGAGNGERLAAPGVPLESYDGALGLFDAPLETGFLAAAFGGTVRLKKDGWAVVGGLSSLAAKVKGKGLELTLCGDGVASCGFVKSVQVFDFAKGKSYASVLEIDRDPSDAKKMVSIGVAMPVVWRLNDGVAALFGGIGFENGSISLSRNGLLCSYANFPEVTCSAYDGVLNGPRFGHTGVCLQASGTIPFSCDQFLVLGGNSPDMSTSLADLMVVEKSAQGSYSIKPVPLDIAADAAADPVAHVFGLEPVRLGDDLWFTLGGARFRSETLGFEAPDVGAYRFDVDPVALTVTPRAVAVQELPDNGQKLLHRVFHTVVTGTDGHGPFALVVGGFGPDGKATTSVLVLREQGGAPRLAKEIKLNKPRFGATVTPFTNAFLPDAWLVSGGFRVVQGRLEPVYGSEVILAPLD